MTKPWFSSEGLEPPACQRPGKTSGRPRRRPLAASNRWWDGVGDRGPWAAPSVPRPPRQVLRRWGGRVDPRSQRSGRAGGPRVVPASAHRRADERTLEDQLAPAAGFTGSFEGRPGSGSVRAESRGGGQAAGAAA